VPLFVIIVMIMAYRELPNYWTKWTFASYSNFSSFTCSSREVAKQHMQQQSITTAVTLMRSQVCVCVCVCVCVGVGSHLQWLRTPLKQSESGTFLGIFFSTY